MEDKEEGEQKYGEPFKHNEDLIPVKGRIIGRNLRLQCNTEILSCMAKVSHSASGRHGPALNFGQAWSLAESSPGRAWP